jgi:Rrf2 family protein
MKISTKGRYALRALVELAEYSEKVKKHIPLKELAKRQNMSEKYLENIFTSLRNNGIVTSLRGAGGGYYLSKGPDKISALDVINAIEGPISVVDCCTSKQFCSNRSKCKTIKLWKKINTKVMDELKKTVLSDLI